MVYCLYWWASFARGYLFEQEVFRDLTQAGIRFEAHQPEYGQQRYAPFDLVAFGLGSGDIKTSIYFLDNLSDLHADYYITRLHDLRSHKSRQVVLLAPDDWHKIDGEPQPGSFANAIRIFPTPVLVQLIRKAWIVVEYEVWKAPVLIWQQLRGNDEQ